MTAVLTGSVYGLPDSLAHSSLRVTRTPALRDYHVRLSTRCSNGALIETTQRPALGAFSRSHRCAGGSDGRRMEGVIDIQ
jgi:hypothetical protein